MAGRLVKTHLPVDDNGILLLRYPQALCRLEMTWTEAVSGRPAHDIAVYGTEGTLVVGAEVWLYTRRKPEGACVPLDDLPRGEGDPFEYFARCIHRGEDPQGLCSPDLGRAAQEIMEAGLRSATSGREIALPIEDHLFRF
jgi:predicted dehydrogenase